MEIIWPQITDKEIKTDATIYQTRELLRKFSLHRNCALLEFNGLPGSRTFDLNIFSLRCRNG